MKSLSSWRLIAAALAFTACLAGAIWTARLRTSIRLPNGSTVRLLGITTVTNTFTTERAWHRGARRVLPDRFQGWIPKPTRSMCARGSNSITCWFSIDGKGPHPPSLDSVGVYAVTHEGQLLDGGGLSGNEPSPIVLERFPRRQRTFVLRFFGTNRIVLGEIRVSNPAYKRYSTWKPDPLPATRTNDGMEVTSVSTRRVVEEHAMAFTNEWFDFDTKIQSQGAVMLNWQVGPRILTDATGNWHGTFGPGMPTNEPAWQLDCWLERDFRSGAFEPRERLLITNLSLPSPGTAMVFNWATNLNGVTIWLGCLAGPGTVVTSNGGFFSAAPTKASSSQAHRTVGFCSGNWMATNQLLTPTLFAAIQDYDGIRNDVRFLFRDQAGRLLNNESPWRVEWSRALNSVGVRGEDYLFRPSISTNTESLTLEVVVQKRKLVSFFVAPPSRGR